MRDYRRAGLELPPEKRKEVEDLRKELATLGTDFSTNIANTQAPIVFTKEEARGPAGKLSELTGVKTGENEYTIKANVTFHANTLLETAKREEVRKRLYTVRDSLAREKNEPVLNQMLALRNKIALRLGYKSWADYQTEVKMAKNAAGASKYINDLIAGAQPKFDGELDELRKIKVAETGDANAKINHWDWRYYANELKKQKYAVDLEELRVYFPYQQVRRWNVRHLSAHLRAEVRADSGAV